MGAGHFGYKTLRHRDTSAPQNWCRSLRGITGGAVSHWNCPGSKCPGFSSIMALVTRCLIPRFWCRSVLRSVPKCPRVSWCQSVLWPKCPVTFRIMNNMSRQIFVETDFNKHIGVQKRRLGSLYSLCTLSCITITLRVQSSSAHSRCCTRSSTFWRFTYCYVMFAVFSY